MIDILYGTGDIYLTLVITVALVLVMLISFSLHEFAHAFAAYRNGDCTAKALGRLTINPFAHIDWLGFICCVFFGFGWAKPVPINPVKFRNYKKGIITTSIAGVIINLILAFIGCGLMFLFDLYIIPYISNIYLQYFLTMFFKFLMSINISLLVFNLLPIPPLDGFNVISAICSYENKFVDFMRRYGTIILFVILIFSDILLYLVNWITTPIYMFWSFIFGLF